jgi:hypothetical protein
MPFHYNRPIMTLHINWPGRRVVVMVIIPLCIVAIGVAMFAAITLPAIRKGYTSPEEDHKSCNCEYFHNVAFHGVLLLALNLPRLDGTPGRRVYIGFWECMEPQCPGQLTPIPAGPTFQLDCRDGFRCRESTTIRFRHRDCLMIRGGQFSLLLLATSFLAPAERGLFNVRTVCTVQSITRA